jgi:hypothetical protein
MLFRDLLSQKGTVEIVATAHYDKCLQKIWTLLEPVLEHRHIRDQRTEEVLIQFVNEFIAKLRNLAEGTLHLKKSLLPFYSTNGM